MSDSKPPEWVGTRQDVATNTDISRQNQSEQDALRNVISELRSEVERLRAALPKPVTWTDRKPDRPGEWWYRTTKKINGAVVTVYESGQPKRLMAFAMPVESWDFQWSSEPCQPPEEPTT